MTTRRLFLDILTLARATGHADGIVRTLREIARFAAIHRPDVVFVLYDQDREELRSLNADWIEKILDGSAKVDTSHFPANPQGQRSFRDRLPSSLKQLWMWIDRPRRKAFLTMERIRLKGGWASSSAAALQDLLINEKYRRELPDEKGERRALLPYDLAVAGTVQPNSSDVLVLAGSDWLAMQQQFDQPLARGSAFKTAVLCYDITPLLFPHFSRERDVRAFKACFDRVFAVSDLVVVTARQIKEDVELYCGRNGLRVPPLDVFRLGADSGPVTHDTNSGLPNGLKSGAYAMFVSTIVPRKNHRFLVSVWRRLLAAGVPQRNGFKLVLVGYQDPSMSDLILELKTDASLSESVVLLSGIDDLLLMRLYTNSAFCLYPSVYEGFGLPVIEGFRYGKPVLASNGGALPETIGPFSPVLDPNDENTWYEMLKLWIENPASRGPYEQMIGSDFKARSWEEAARDFFSIIDRALN